MALSKSYTFSYLESFLRVLTAQVALDDIQSKTLMKIVNKNTLDIAEMLNGATAPDYGATQVLGDVGINYSETEVLADSYTNATKTVGKTAHGLTNADIGRRILLHTEIPGIAGISTIASVPTSSTFIIADTQHASLGSGALYYFVLSRHSGAHLDISTLKIDKIIKLVDGTNGLVGPQKDFPFENLANMDDYDKSIFYSHFGELLILFKGSGIPAWGTLTLYYYRLPTLVTEDADYIDMKDKYIPLLIDKCKLELYELANKLAPKELSQSVDSKTQLIRQMNEGKLQTISGKNK